MTRFEIAQTILDMNIDDVTSGIFDRHGEYDMITIYDDGEVRMDINYERGIMEIFGLTEFEFELLDDWYFIVRGGMTYGT